jgi:hypothetical protein
MGFTYGGLVSNITVPVGISILSTVKGSPTVVNTATPHNLLNGDIVDITDHQTCTGVNGIGLTVTVTSSTQFTVPINTSTYTSGGATGFVWPRVYTQNRTTIPVDGDPNDAATYAPGFMSNADENTFAFAYMPLYYLGNGNLSATAVHTDNLFGTPWAWVKATAPGGSASAPVQATSPTSGTAFGSLLHAGAIPVAGADIIELQLDFSYGWTTPLGSDPDQSIFFALNCAYYVPGTATPTFTQEIPQSSKKVNSQILTISAVNYQVPQSGGLSLHGCFNVAGNLTLQGAGAVDTAGMFDVQLYAGAKHGSSGDSVGFVFGDAHFTCKVWRPTSITQET